LAQRFAFFVEEFALSVNNQSSSEDHAVRQGQPDCVADFVA
jgi:hypothetical protein